MNFQLAREPRGDILPQWFLFSLVFNFHFYSIRETSSFWIRVSMRLHFDFTTAGCLSRRFHFCFCQPVADVLYRQKFAVWLLVFQSESYEYRAGCFRYGGILRAKPLSCGNEVPQNGQGAVFARRWEKKCCSNSEGLLGEREMKSN